MRGPFANLDKPSSRASLAVLERKSADFDFASLRRLALDAAATLLSTAKLEPQRQFVGKATSARKNSASTSKTVSNPSVEAERGAASDALSVAVSKAVASAKDEAYWRSISGT